MTVMMMKVHNLHIAVRVLYTGNVDNVDVELVMRNVVQMRLLVVHLLEQKRKVTAIMWLISGVNW